MKMISRFASKQIYTKKLSKIMNIIEIKNLTKEFKKKTAVNNISLNIKKGEIFGLLGPNGAGKTTLISMLSTILLPTNGKVKINNLDLKKDSKKIRKIIGLVFQESILDEDLSAKDNLDIHARLYKISKEKRKRKIKELLKLVSLEDIADKKISTFSGGMKRKIELIRGLINEPKILFLDEPTLGLDPTTRSKIWQYIKELNKKEKLTIILTTHYMEEADYLCSRVGIINKGNFKIIDSPQKLKKSLKGDIIEIKTNKLQKNFLDLIKKLKFVKDAEIVDNSIRLYVSNSEDKIERVIDFLKKHKIKIKSILMKTPTLEDVFLHYTGEELQ
ncbi:MAG: ATP-binding cassette domain-containing protein [Candidatus Pacearchaeota archaeon]|nr:ATP-binding cassette domain-containing protein [Candidatus Pacearchaeota archaeon]